MKIKEPLVVLFAILVLVFVIYLATSSSSESGPISTDINNNSNNTMALNIKSSAFNNNENIPSKYTCDDDMGGMSPPLAIEGVDPNAKSLVLIMDDPDAKSVVGYTFVHWVVFNIDPKITEIKSVWQTEVGVRGQRSGGENGQPSLNYTGPCPPSGTHHYYFKLYSLDSTLSLQEGATKDEVEAAMKGHILQQAELIGLYQKNK